MRGIKSNILSSHKILSSVGGLLSTKQLLVLQTCFEEFSFSINYVCDYSQVVHTFRTTAGNSRKCLVKTTSLSDEQIPRKFSILSLATKSSRHLSSPLWFSLASLSSHLLTKLETNSYRSRKTSLNTTRKQTRSSPASTTSLFQHSTCSCGLGHCRPQTSCHPCTR